MEYFTIYSRPESRDRWWVERGDGVTIGEATNDADVRMLLPPGVVLLRDDFDIGRCARSTWMAAR